MIVQFVVVALIVVSAAAFHPSLQNAQRCLSYETSLSMGKTRKAQKRQKVEQTRPKNFFDAIDDAQDKPVEPKKKKKKKKGKVEGDEATTSSEEEEREARAQDARMRMDQRPDVSTMIVDEETGIEIVAQGKSVMDVVTRKAVQLSSLGPDYRLAQQFPGVPPEIREKYRVDWKTVTVQEMVDGLKSAAMVDLPDGSRGIPPHPSVANAAIDYVTANRDYLGRRMKSTLGRLQMRAMSVGNKEEAIELGALWKNFLTLENHISAPFRQIIMDAEGRVGPNFGNLDVKSYADGDVYERAANYLVLKGMVAHWEKKVVDADYVERTPQTKENYISILARGDPKRYLPDSPILFTLKECTQVCAMAQQMNKAFCDTAELFDDLPPEVRFLEKALAIKGGVPLRKFVADEFCPNENITPEGLREGLRRLSVQLENMQIDPYADITNILERLINAMSVGTEDERDPYVEYLVSKDPNGPGNFQTYTFDHEKLSLVRFLDSQYESAGGSSPEIPTGGIGGLFNFGNSKPEVKKVVDEGTTYKVPKERAAGRPHNLGWLDMLEEEQKDSNMRLGKVPPGKIIME